MDNNKNIYVTDGQDLAEKVEELVEAGVTDVTVNVNTLNYTRYQKSHDGLELHPVIDGINKAVGKKLHIRLAVSLQEGFSDDEILDFLQLTFQHKYDIVFMPTMPYEKIKAKMPALRETEQEFEDVEMYKYPGSVGRIGFLKYQEKKLYAGKALQYEKRTGRASRSGPAFEICRKRSE